MRNSLIQLPLKMVGSSTFGRYPKISLEKTYNQIISDGWMVPYPGHKRVATIADNIQGRTIFASDYFRKMIFVVGDNVYLADAGVNVTHIGNLQTSVGDVFIDDNKGDQIGICDKLNIYMYNFSTGLLQKADIDFLPGWIAYINGYFVSVDLITGKWRLSELNNGLSWPITLDGTSYVGEFQTQADRAVAAIPVPSKANLLYVMGSIVTESWYDLGYNLFPFQKSTFFDIPYGTANSATIAWINEYVMWLGGNAQGGYVIMASQGDMPEQISSDGINFLLSSLKNPRQSFGFAFEKDGHILYQLTFTDPDDNLTLLYDFQTQKFFHVCNENQDFHIAKKVAFFNNTFYFVSVTDGHLYELSDKYTSFDGKEIPRIRICPPIRMRDGESFVLEHTTFPIEQGDSFQDQRVDLAVSLDGAQSFSSYISHTLNPIGKRLNKFDVYNLGWGNDITLQWRFWSQDRFVYTDGIAEISQ